jgi:hypothetical protein
MPGQEHETPGQSSRVEHATPDEHVALGIPAPPSPRGRRTTSSSPHATTIVATKSMALPRRMTLELTSTMGAGERGETP